MRVSQTVIAANTRSIILLPLLAICLDLQGRPALADSIDTVVTYTLENVSLGNSNPLPDGSVIAGGALSGSFEVSYTQGGAVDVNAPITANFVLSGEPILNNVQYIVDGTIEPSVNNQNLNGSINFTESNTYYANLPISQASITEITLNSPQIFIDLGFPTLSEFGTTPLAPNLYAQTSVEYSETTPIPINTLTNTVLEFNPLVDGTILAYTSITGSVCGSLTGSCNVPAVTANATAIGGGNTQYTYSFSGLSGTGDVFIPILDPAGLVGSSLPGDTTLITDQTTIEADWPGSDNIIPSGESMFNDPAALLEVPDSGANPFSFLDSDPAIDGPILADGTLLDPPVPGPAPVPEPDTLWLVTGALVGFGLMGWRRTNAGDRYSSRAT